eukprot:sb/3469042/
MLARTLRDFILRLFRDRSSDSEKVMGGLWKLAVPNIKYGLGEAARSLAWPLQLRELQRFIPTLGLGDIVRHMCEIEVPNDAPPARFAVEFFPFEIQLRASDRTIFQTILNQNIITAKTKKFISMAISDHFLLPRQYTNLCRYVILIQNCLKNRSITGPKLYLKREKFYSCFKLVTIFSCHPTLNSKLRSMKNGMRDHIADQRDKNVPFVGSALKERGREGEREREREIERERDRERKMER